MTSVVEPSDVTSARGAPTDRGAHRGAVSVARALCLLRFDVSQAASRAVVVLSFALVASRRWWQMGDHPSGIDQGHWLAFGRAYWGKGNPSLTDLFPVSVMPPVVPTLMAGGTLLFGPETTSRMLATLSLLAVMLATFLLTRRISLPLVAAAMAVVVGMSATVVEPAAWGGYPQNAALAEMVIALLLVSRYLGNSRLSYLGGYGVACLGIAATHHAYFGIAMGAVAAVNVAWWASGPGWRAFRTRMAGVALGSVPGMAVFGLVAWSLFSADYKPAIDASGSSLVGSLEFAFPTVRWLWAALGIVGAIGLASNSLRREHAAEWRAAMALVLVAVVGFFLTGEPRLLPPLVVGGAAGVAWALRGLARRVGASAGASVAVAAALVVIGLAWPSTDQKAQIAFDYYRVLDPSLAGAASFVDSAPMPGSAAIRTDARGWPVGWWFRGLTDRPVLVGSDEKWLGFAEERRQASLVNGLFDVTSSPEDVRSLALERGVALLVFRPGDWLGWQDWSFGEGDPLVRVYDDGGYVVLAVRRGP